MNVLPTDYFLDFFSSNSWALFLFGKKVQKTKPVMHISKAIFLLFDLYFKRPEIQQIIIFQWDFISVEYFQATINSTISLYYC